MNPKIIKYIYYQFPWQLLMLAIFVQSSMGQIEIPDLGIVWSDKLIHFIVFGILGLLVARGFYHLNNGDLQKKNFKIALILCSIYAASDEIHQLWVMGRDGNLYDFIADILGIIVFVWLYKKYQDFRSKTSMMSLKDGAESSI